MEVLRCECDSCNDGCKISGSRQTDVHQRFFVSIEHALNTIDTRGSRKTVEGEAVAGGGWAAACADETSEAVRGELLAGIVALKNVAHGRNGSLVPVAMKRELGRRKL